MEEIVHSLGIEWKLLIAQVINFGLLALVLFKLVYKPLFKILDERTAMVKDAAEKSSSIEALLLEAKASGEILLAEARKTSDKIIKSAEITAQDLSKKTADEAKAHANKIVAEAKLEMDAQMAKHQKEFRNEAISIVADAVERTVGKYLDTNAKQKLAEEAGNEVAKIETFIK